MGIASVVKWNGPDNVYAWKFPSEELATYSQIIVSETQEAIMVSEGRMLGPFGPGRHSLDNSKNIAVLNKFLKMTLGNKTPFTCEVWFVNRSYQLDVKWGTPSPLQIKDAMHNILLPVRARGQFGIRVKESKKFLKKLVGTVGSFGESELQSYFRGIVITQIKSLLGKQLVTDKLSVLEIAPHLDDLSNKVQKQI